MKKRKKLLILSFLVIILLVGGFLTFNYITTPSTTIHQETTERAKEYIATQKQAQNTDWTYVDLKGNNNKEKQVLGQQNLLVKNCYQVEIPFSIKFIREDKGICQRYISLLEPEGGKIIIYQNDGLPARLEEFSGISFRRMEDQPYEEKLLTINDHDYLTFTKTEGSYERTAFVVDGGRLFVVNLLTYTNQNLDNEYEEMLKSINFLK